MAQSDTAKWPAYGVGPEKHLHALGVITVNYNRLEMALDRLLYMYLGASREPYCHIFKALNLHSQTALFNLCISQEESDPALRDGLLYFCACFLICAENRNTLMHSNVDWRATIRMRRERQSG